MQYLSAVAKFNKQSTKMPTKLSAKPALLTAQKIAAFRETIKDDEGWEMEEIVRALDTSQTTTRTIISKNKWSIPQWSTKKKRIINVLVNPKTLQKYAK